MIPFRAVVEVESEGAFLTKEPIKLYENGDVTDVPIITGFTKDEGAIRASCKLAEVFVRKIEKI